MPKKQRLGVVAIALVAGLIGGLFASFLLEGSRDAQAASVSAGDKDPGYRITGNAEDGAYVVNSFGEVYYLRNNGKPKHIGQVSRGSK